MRWREVSTRTTISKRSRGAAKKLPTAPFRPTPVAWIALGMLPFIIILLAIMGISRLRAGNLGGVALEITEKTLGFRSGPNESWHMLPLDQIAGVEWTGPETIGVRTIGGSVQAVPYGFLGQEERAVLMRTVSRPEAKGHVARPGTQT